MAAIEPATAVPGGPPAAVRCRPVMPADLDGIVRLLMRGFPDRTESYWRAGLARHAARDLPDGYPVYGYMLDHGGQAVGVILTLFTSIEIGGRPTVRCNLSSWYVEPAFRAQAVLLDNLAMRRKEVTYLNVTPAPQTWAMQEARRFKRYCRGQMLAFPLLGRVVRGVRIRKVTPDDLLLDITPAERTLVADHRRYGCLCFVGTDARGSQPFIFVRRRIGLTQKRSGRGALPCLQLVYCRDVADLPDFLGSLGRRLALGLEVPWMVIDADRQIPGVVGRYFEGRGPKYFRGPDPVRLGDLAYTEMVLFGP